MRRFFLPWRRHRAPRPAPAELVADLQRTRALAEEASIRSIQALDTAQEAWRPTRMLAFMLWLDLHPPAEELPISVILATRDRPQQLERAIASVCAQRYENWELIVVDDGSDPGTRNAAERAGDERVRLVEGPRRGLGAARNAGLAVASGEVVCYLDDDNLMHPSWLHAVAYVFAAREDVEVGYGVTIGEHRTPDDPSAFGWWPSFWQLPWSRELLLSENVTDAGALAHRRDLPEARFDEELPTGEDWDLLIRLTTDREAMMIPAPSHAYTMSNEDRMSRDPGHHPGLEQIRRRHVGD